MSYENRLKELDILLPEAPSPVGSYVPCIRSGSLLFLSGILPLKNGVLLYRGRVGKDITTEEARAASRWIVSNALSVISQALGSLDLIARCVKLNGYVASSDDFHDQPLVINAASDLLVDIFGDNGRHARAAIGVNALPLNAPVEIDFVFEIRDSSPDVHS